MSKIAGIGGVSRSGKTFLAGMICDILVSRGRSCIIFHQDEFVRPEDELPRIRDHIDWEHPGSIDFDRLREAVSGARGNYEHIIVEGLFAFADPALTAMYDDCLMIRLGREAFMERKRADLRWGMEPDWYISHIWDAFLRYGEPSATCLAHEIDGSVDFEPSLFMKYISV